MAELSTNQQQMAAISSCDVRVFRGAVANCDHYLPVVVADIKLKLRQARAVSKRRHLYDIARLKSPGVRFVLELL